MASNDHKKSPAIKTRAVGNVLGKEIPVRRCRTTGKKRVGHLAGVGGKKFCKLLQSLREGGENLEGKAHDRGRPG